jgi:hypothetical protein
MTMVFLKITTKKKINKTSISKFSDIDESESELIFVVGKNLWEGWGYNWDEPEFTLEKIGKKRKDENKIMIFKHYSLDLFEDEYKALKQLKDFEMMCSENNIKFKIIDTKIK